MRQIYEVIINQLTATSLRHVTRNIEVCRKITLSTNLTELRLINLIMDISGISRKVVKICKLDILTTSSRCDLDEDFSV